MFRTMLFHVYRSSLNSSGKGIASLLATFEYVLGLILHSGQALIEATRRLPFNTLMKRRDIGYMFPFSTSFTSVAIWLARSDGTALPTW
jgi:hypothetical protein